MTHKDIKLFKESGEEILDEKNALISAYGLTTEHGSMFKPVTVAMTFRYLQIVFLFKKCYREI